MVSENRAFITYVMADVYALLDFLSGRAKPALGPLPPLPAQGVQAADHRLDASEHEDETSSAFVRRAMTIGKQVADPDAEISEDDAAFLIQARDLLNVRAAPATGNSIIFTLLVIDSIHSLRSGVDRQNPAGPIYVFRDVWLEPAAKRLANSVKWWLRMMIILLAITVMASVYVAYGKLLSDTLDAVNRDNGANLAYLATEMNESPTALGKDQKLIKNFCESEPPGYQKYRNCQDHYTLIQRKSDVRNLLQKWIFWPTSFAEESAPNTAYPTQSEAVQQLATVRIGVLGNYVLPVLYGIIGSLGFVLRQFNRRLADRVLTSRESRASHIRIILGAVSGACIGLFFNNSAGAAQTTGIGGAAVTLSASAIAFLAGYGVEAVFNSLDALLIHVFSLTPRGRAQIAHPAEVAAEKHH